MHDLEFESLLSLVLACHQCNNEIQLYEQYGDIHPILEDINSFSRELLKVDITPSTAFEELTNDFLWKTVSKLSLNFGVECFNLSDAGKQILDQLACSLQTIEPHSIFIAAFSCSVRKAHSSSWNHFCEAVDHPEWKVKILSIDQSSAADKSDRFSMKSSENLTTSGMALAAFKDDSFNEAAAAVLDNFETFTPPASTTTLDELYQAMHETALNTKSKGPKR